MILPQLSHLMISGRVPSCYDLNFYICSVGRLYRLYTVKVRQQMVEAPLDLLDLSGKLHTD